MTSIFNFELSDEMVSWRGQRQQRDRKITGYLEWLSYYEKWGHGSLARTMKTQCALQCEMGNVIRDDTPTTSLGLRRDLFNVERARGP